MIIPGILSFSRSCGNPGTNFLKRKLFPSAYELEKFGFRTCDFHSFSNVQRKGLSCGTVYTNRDAHKNDDCDSKGVVTRNVCVFL